MKGKLQLPEEKEKRRGIEGWDMWFSVFFLSNVLTIISSVNISIGSLHDKVNLPTNNINICSISCFGTWEWILGMPAGPYLYADDLIEVLKKKHASGTYKNLVSH